MKTDTDTDILKNIMSGMYKNFYLVYIRKSTDEPDNQKNSIAYQKAEITRFAVRQKLPIAPVTLESFCLDGIISEKHSGFKEDYDVSFTNDGKIQYNIGRPKFFKLMSFLNNGYFKGVICLSWDRISRNKADNTVISKLTKQGVDFRFSLASYDNSSAGEFHKDMDGVLAEQTSRNTSEKVRLATHNLRDRGIVTYKAPIGYLNQGSMYHKPFDPIRAPIIKQMFELYATGDWALADLALWATKQGLTTVPSRRKRTTTELLAEESDDMLPIEKVSHAITFGHTHKILTNIFYTGMMIGNNHAPIRSISHEALISDELFYSVQRALKNRNISTKYTDKLPYLHRGFARCADCSRAFTPYVKKGISYFSVRCQPNCTNTKKNFNISFLETEMGKIMSSLSFTQEEKVEIDKSMTTDILDIEQKRNKQIEVTDRRQRKIREDLAYLKTSKLDLLRSGVYSPESYLGEEQRLNAELMLLQTDTQSSTTELAPIVRDVQILSELLKNGSAYYSFASNEEREQIIKIVFTELSLSQNTLQYKVKNGFKALESRFTSVCAGGGS